MNRSQYLTLAFILTLLFVFFKIYQHNSIVKLIYKKQRLENTKQRMRKEKNDLLVHLYTLKKQDVIREKATKELALQALKPSQVITVTSLHVKLPPLPRLRRTGRRARRGYGC
jgi:cell division protein FtsL